MMKKDPFVILNENDVGDTSDTRLVGCHLSEEKASLFRLTALYSGSSVNKLLTSLITNYLDDVKEADLLSTILTRIIMEWFRRVEEEGMDGGSLEEWKLYKKEVEERLQKTYKMKGFYLEKIIGGLDGARKAAIRIHEENKK